MSSIEVARYTGEHGDDVLTGNERHRIGVTNTRAPGDFLHGLAEKATYSLGITVDPPLLGEVGPGAIRVGCCISVKADN